MTPVQLTAFLSRAPLFAGLTGAARAAVCLRMDVVDLRGGETLFSEGDPGDAWYVIVKGEVAIVKNTASGAPHELARLESGEAFGEMALLDNAARVATATAETRATLARLPTTQLHALIAEEPHVAAQLILAMARVLCARQRELTSVLTDLVDDPQTARPGPHEMMAVLLGLRG